jgi:drug/metabolite transporter (DMT)-like permease
MDIILRHGPTPPRSEERRQAPLSAKAYRNWGIAFGVAGVLAFSLRPILIKLAYAAHPVSPTTLLFLRMTLSLPFFAGVGWWLRARQPRICAGDWAAIAALGFLGYYAASLLDFLGLQYVGAGVGRLILFLYPTLVLLLSFLFFGKGPRPRELAAVVVSYAGIALVVSNQAGGGEQGKLFALGALLIFGSALCYAIYLVASSEMVKRVGSMRFTAYSMLVSTLPALVQFFLLEPMSSLELPGAVWGYAIVLATFSTVLPLFLQAEALNRIGANHFALIGAVGPVSVALTSTLGLGEPFTWVQAIGGLLVISGVVLVSLRPKSMRI